MGKKAKGFEGGDSLMMANPSGRKGAAFEIGVLKWLRSRNVIAERMRLVGKKDEGDIVAISEVGGLHHRYERRAA